jgi:hypothetical protein
MSEPPRGINWTLEDGPLPEGSKIEPADGYALLHYRGPKLVDRIEILGFLLNQKRMTLGVALTQEDAARGRPDDDCAMLEPDKTVAWGGQSWPDYET